MVLAAVRPITVDSDRVIVVECGELRPSGNDRVVVSVAGRDIEASVIASPDRLLTPGMATEGELLRVIERTLDKARIAMAALDSHVGAGLPALGEVVVTDQGSGVVTGLDVPRGIVRVELADAMTVQLHMLRDSA
jgi:hypothetical protein